MYLEHLDEPADLRGLSYEELDALAGHIRDFVVAAVRDTGRHRIVETDFAGHKVRALVPAGMPVPEGDTSIRFDPGHTQIYADGWIVE